jgi:spermidine/putrescine transport system substrate-binding protein
MRRQVRDEGRNVSGGLFGRPLSRRSFLAGTMLAGVATPTLASLLAACGKSASESSGGLSIPAPTNPVRWPISTRNPAIKPGLRPERGSTLRIYNYASYLGPKVIKDFEDTYGVDISVSTFNDEDEALNKLASGQLKFDLYFPSYDSLARLVSANLLRPLTHEYITNIDNVWAQFKNPWYDQGWRYSVPYSVYTTGIGWRTDLVSEDIGARENPYDVFWDPRYAGNIALIDDWHTAMGMVLLRNGIYDINTTKAADIKLMHDQMIDMLGKTKPRVTVNMYTDLPAGQYGLSQMWSGDVVNAQYYLPKGQSADVLRYWFPKDGRGMVDNDLMVVLAQGGNPVAAHFFINYLLDAKVASQNFGYIGYQPPQNSINPTELVADEYLPQNLATATVLPRYFTEGARLLQLPQAADNAYHQIWQEFKAGG